MHAARLHAFGPAENLTYEEAPDPVPGPGQVRIAVEAAGVHLIDASIRAGRQGGPLPLPELPTIPGREVAGVVDALGEGADEKWLGRRVTAHLGPVPGGYASLAVTGAERLHTVPDALSFPAAIAMIGTGRTVMAVLRGHDIGPGDTVLVLSAAGGMGALLVQYAKHKGAYVIGAAGGEAKTALARKLGADLALDYLRDDWADRIRAELGTERPVSHLFDGPGGALSRTAVDLLAPGSGHFLYGGSSSLVAEDTTEPLTDEEREARGITAHSIPLKTVQDHLRELEEQSLDYAARGILTPLVTTFPLAEAGAAHHALETRGTTGKVVLVP